MEAKKLNKKQQKEIDNRVERAFYANCYGVQIGVLDLGKVFAAGRNAVLAGGDDEAVAKAIVEVVNVVRKN